MVDVVASEVGKIVLEKLISGVLKEGQSLLDVNSDVESLKETRLTITALLLDAENAKRTTQVQLVVLDRLTCALERMNDFLESRAHRAMRKRIMRSRPVQELFHWFFSPSSNPILSAVRDTRKVKALRRELDRISRDYTHFGNIFSAPSDLVRQTWMPTSSTGPYVDSKEVIGRDGDRDMILSMIVDPKETLSVLPLVGIGGIGKTTLAQVVYSNEWVENHYDLRLWVCIGQVFDFEEVVRKMVESLTQESLLHWDMAQLQNRLLPLIRRKKCLIVLDNVWNHDSLGSNWLGLKSLLGFHDARRTVLITTRSNTVARLMGTVDQYGLGDLKAEDSWHLFQRVVSTQSREPRCEEIGKEIVRMCPNVPLVIHAIGCLSRGMDSIDRWEALRDQLARETLCGRVPGVMETLKLSYDQLHPNGLKLCFRYWSLFPKGFELEMDKFIYMCVALGYVETPRQENKNLADVAEDYLGRLKDLGLISETWGLNLQMHDKMHDLAISLSKFRCKMVDHGEQEDLGLISEERDRNLRMHEIIHALAISLLVDHGEREDLGLISKKRGWNLQMHDTSYDLAISLSKSRCKMVDHGEQELDESIRHVSFSRSAELSANFFCSSVFKFKKQLRSIHVFRGRFDPPIKLTLKGLSKFEYLRVFSLSNVGLEEVPTTICKLIHLRYLDLSSNKFRKLSKEISQLTSMLYLNLSHCEELQELPGELGGLEKLLALNLNFCPELQKLPGNIGKLTNLHSLDLQRCSRIQELPSSIIKCVNLRHLRLEGCRLLKHMPLGLGNLTHLQTLDWFVARGQSWGSIDPNSPNECNQSDAADDHVGGLDELNHLNSLKETLTIRVDGCWSSVSEAMAANLQAKEKLQELCIIFDGGSRKDNEMMLQGFQPHANLKKLSIANYIGETLPSWLNGQGYLPNLKEIRISGTEVHRYLGSLGRLPSLKVLEMGTVPEREIIEKTPTVGPSNESMKADATADEANPNPGPETNADTPAAPLFPSLERLQLTSMFDVAGRGRSNSRGECFRLGAHESANAFPRLKTLRFEFLEWEVVPKEFQQVPSLESLKFVGCRQLKEIPDCIDSLKSLQRLTIVDSPKLTLLPKQIANLANLKYFTVGGCPNLVERCRKPSGEDWPLIQHVPHVSLLE